ncbi:MAG: DUF4328 domain-containing protein [Bacteroidia bacterium]|nr:DUF4328 domain-containing protein [Bacteroidia bacterium]
MKQLKPNDKRAKAAMLMVCIVMGFEIVNIISDFFQYQLLESGNLNSEIANENDIRQALVALVSTVLFIVSAITFIMWFRRASYNLHTKVDHLKHSEGWAAGCWFVPVLCWFRPFQIMKELYEETDVLLERETRNYEKRITTSILGLWWTIWVLRNVIGQFLMRGAFKAETADQLSVSTVGSMISSGLQILLGFITVKIIRDYSKIEPLFYEIKEPPTLTFPDRVFADDQTKI